MIAARRGGSREPETALRYTLIPFHGQIFLRAA